MSRQRPSIIGTLLATDPEPTGAPAKRPRRIIHTSLYIPSAVYRLLEAIAFDRGRPDGRRTKVHDLILEGISVVLQRHGHPPIEEFKGK